MLFKLDANTERQLIEISALEMLTFQQALKMLIQLYFETKAEEFESLNFD